MNRKQQQKRVGQTRRLRPVPIDGSGTPVDDPWEVTSAGDDGLQLVNRRAAQRLQLGYDHIQEFRTPDFLVLKSTVLLLPSGPQLEPIVAAPKVTLTVKQPFPAPTQSHVGLWTQEIHIIPSRKDDVPDATVEIGFHEMYETGAYEVIPDDPRQARFIQERFGAEGRAKSDRFRVGLVALPRGTWLRLTFEGVTPPRPREIRLTPYLKY